MTILVPANVKKADLDKIYSDLKKKNKKAKPSSFIGKFPFEGDSLEFQKDLR